jgi:ABC-2 type transport system ATP-binding protein
MMLDIQNLWKRYGDRPVLAGLTLQVPAGEIYGLLGPNGAGKTTTINILCDLLRADRGQITIANRPISAATKPLIGIAPQENLLYRSLTCAENLDFFARIYGVRSPERRRRVQECLDFVGLGARARSPVETLSGGMQRRLNLAVALVHQPKLVVLDEPTVGLDIEARYDLWDLIRHLKDQGTTVLLTTHLLDEAERLCDRIGILKQGQILAAGTLAELRSQVPAAELARLQTSDLDGAIARAESLGWAYRVRSRELVLLLPEVLELPELLAKFAGVAIDSLARQAVDLEAIYLEVTRSVD